MLRAYKKVGETPLEMLNRLRNEQPELQHKKLSYAGRLDPMAEGEMIVLINEENKHYKSFLSRRKHYVTTFIVGISTDTGDILGKITDWTPDTPYLHRDNIYKEVSTIMHITEQTYPWFSSQTVDGIKLFDHFKKGNTQIERPKRLVTIYNAQVQSIETISITDLQTHVHERIPLVSGDFRQEEILECWNTHLKQCSPNKKFQIFTVVIEVSSGTYIRDITNHFSVPTTLLSLKRTKIDTIL